MGSSDSSSQKKLRYQSRLFHLKAFLRLENRPPELLTHVYWTEALVPHLWASPILENPHNMPAGFPRLRGPKEQGRSHISLYLTLKRHTQSFLQHPVGYPGQPFQCGRRTHKDINAKGLKSLRTPSSSSVLESPGIPR